MVLDQWAQRWCIPDAALAELRQLWRMNSTGVAPKDKDYSEAAMQNLVRLEASQKGARLWRNNVGATYTPEGSFIRYGLANESTGVNRLIKSADLIGIKPVVIKPEHIGMVIGQFMSREIKASNWRYTGTDRELAQLKWAELILSLGGDACFAVGQGTI